MALTADQNIALYDILDVAWIDGTNTTSYFVTNALGTLASQATVAGPTQTSAVTQITAWLAGMGASTLTNLSALLDRYIALGTQVTDIENGTVGDISGVTNRVDRERELITRRVRRRCPFYPFQEVIAKQNGLSGGGITVPGIR